MAVEQAHAERAFQFGNRAGDGGLYGVQALRCFPHAALLHDGHENVEVLQLDRSSDAIVELHAAPIAVLLCDHQTIALYRYVCRPYARDIGTSQAIVMRL